MTEDPRLHDIERAFHTVRQSLLSERSPEGYWIGHLSSSALATATAVSALSVTNRPDHTYLIDPGVLWLIRTQNPDGGWGDTPNSPSNLSTTVLVRAALLLSNSETVHPDASRRAREYISSHAGPSPNHLTEALATIYGRDRTFAVPILTNCALAGLVPWNKIPPLPFEVATLPQPVLHLFHLHVVSYAMPALIAIGQLLHHHHPTSNPALRIIRRAAIAPTLRKLTRIQPSTGGFLEATPLTSFVVMSLAGAGRADHPVARRGLDFLRRSARPDGSWPIDTNLSTWLTTQAVSTLAATGGLPDPHLTRYWLLNQQHARVHPYTSSPPRGWAWTPLDGGVPDTDDTAGALIALRHLGPDVPTDSVRSALRWLANLQNRDGGWPTFCRGWRKLPFDRSSPDLAAHAIRAFSAWPELTPPRTRHRIIASAFAYLRSNQLPDGSWLPLWFGNQHHPDRSNPVYGTARVLKAYVEAGRSRDPEARRGAAFLLSVHNPDGGWSGTPGVPSSVEETALAVEALADFTDDPSVREHMLTGACFLARRIADGALAEPTPIGLYFTMLWYWEKLYPIIWSTGALAAAFTSLSRSHTEASVRK